MCKIAVSITTINVPTIISQLEDNRLKYKHDPVLYIVTGDRKTKDSEVETYVQGVSNRTDSKIVYLTVEEQDSFLMALEARAFRRAMPYNCIARRNIGDLYAYVHGAEIIIRLDDDNFPMDGHDFFEGHSITGESKMLPSVYSSDSGWFNILKFLHYKNMNRRISEPIYPRGFPFENRGIFDDIDHEGVRTEKSGHVVVNQGLWYGAPDVDAACRLQYPNIEVVPGISKFLDIAVDFGTWCPINTQNTALHRSLLPASFACPYFGRYDDIFAGYIMRRVMDEMKDYCTYGNPFVNQKRNEHNVYIDMEAELPGMAFCADFCALLRSWKAPDFSQPMSSPVAKNLYISYMYDLLDYLEEAIRESLTGFWGWYAKSGELMNLWVELIDTIDKEGVTVEFTDAHNF